MRSLVLALAALLFAAVPTRADVIDEALQNAFLAYEDAYPHLPKDLFGVDTKAYRDALALFRFSTAHWDGGPLELAIAARPDASGPCADFAAYVDLPPRDGAVTLNICPEFVSSGTPGLRTLTILHELVHVVAGPDECRAMAFAAQVEQRATGAYTRVDRYWQANGCDGSAFSLP